MAKPTDNPDANHFNPKFRRRRKWQGATWTPGTVSADTESGVWCPQHRMRHGYMSKQLKADYEKGTNGKFRILWICRESGNVIEEKEL